jgi:serine/threonine protein kinase
MPTKDDVEFLALLVHRRKLSKDLAEAVFTELQRGGELDPLLEGALGCSASEVAKLRRTRAGEIPEIPGYEVIQKIGSGGTADVFRVHEKKSGRVIALKVLREDQAENAATKKAFIEEAKLLEKLRHAGLVEGYGAARYGELYFSRLEYIDGRTLLEMLDDDVRFDETQALRIVLTVAEVLAWLGAHAVVHRDIKPGNIMLASDGRVKLIDLGFAACEGAKARNDKASAPCSTSRPSRSRRRGRGHAQRHLQPRRDALPPRRRPAALRFVGRSRGAAHAGHGVAALARTEEPRPLAPPALLHREDDGQGSRGSDTRRGRS